MSKFAAAKRSTRSYNGLVELGKTAEELGSIFRMDLPEDEKEK